MLSLYKSLCFVFLSLVFFSANASNTRAQVNHQDSINKAKFYLTRAGVIGRVSITDSCKYYFKNAKEMFYQLEEWKLLTNTYFLESYLFSRHGNYDNSALGYLRAIEITKSKLPSEKILLIDLLNRLGTAYYELFNNEKAIKYYTEGASYYDEIGGHKIFGYLYDNLSRVYILNKDFDIALQFLEKSFSIKLNIDSKSANFGYYYRNKGVILFETGKLDLAEKSLKKAVSILKDKNLDVALVCYNYLSLIARKNNHLNKAISIIENCIELIKTNKEDSKIAGMLSAFYINLGDCFNLQGNTSLAHKYYLKSVKVSVPGNADKENLVLGNSYKNLNQIDSALIHYQNGIINLNPNFNNASLESNPTLDQIKIKEYLLDLLIAKADALEIKYQSDQKTNVTFLNTAYETNLLSIQLLDMMVDDVSEASKTVLGDYITPTYEQTIRTNLALGNLKNDLSYKLKAFQLSEKSKAGILLSGIQSSKAKYFAGIPDSLLSLEKELRINLSFNQSQLQSLTGNKDGYDTIKVNEYKEKIFDFNRKREDLTLQFETEFPKYHQLKYQNEQISVAEVQQSLDEQTTLVEYFLGDSTFYAFTITKNDYEVYELPVNKELGLQVRMIQKSIESADFGKYSEIAFDLYEKLIAPLKLETESLIIIPDGALWHLNFDILLSEKPAKQDFKKCGYLINDFTISYAYSATLLQKVYEQNLPPAENECLAFSFRNTDDTSAGDYIAMRGSRDEEKIDLPGTRKEIAAVSEVMEGAYYFGKYANEKNFKENAKDYRILHLALHGEIDNNTPMNSKLFFTQSEDSVSENVEDNYLHAYELYNTELNAELAVLSACNTGSGKLVKGEGIMSMGRAFTYAGCKSLLMSQWELSDTHTPGIMKDFYLNLKEGKPKAAALRQAKLNYLKSSNNISANPYYWASLVQLGNNDPLPQSDYSLWMSLGGILIILSSILFLKRRK